MMFNRHFFKIKMVIGATLLTLVAVSSYAYTDESPGWSFAHHNKVYFNSNHVKVRYTYTGYCITSGQSWKGLTVRYNGNNAKIDAYCGRKGSTDVAISFYNALDFEASDIGYQTGTALWPEKLNFFVEGEIRLNGDKYDLMPAQGHTGGLNNWWCGGKGFVGISARDLLCSRDGKYSIWVDFSNDHSFRVTANATNPNWMQLYIDDDKKLSEFAIPGTHDSGTYAMNYSDIYNEYLVCQNYAILAQFYFGIRCFDIRLGYDDGLYVYHQQYKAHLHFDTVIREAFEFLDKYPKETVILIIKHASEVEGPIADAFADVLKERNPSMDRYWLANTMPTMGEARNKIVFINRDGCIDDGINVHWQNNATFKSEEGVPFYIQDVYDNSDEQAKKEEVFKNLQNIALKDPGAYWYVNFLSSSDDNPPKNNAKYMNPWANKFLYPFGSSYDLGQLTEVVMMNFAGKYQAPGIVSDLICNNAIHSSNSLSINGAGIPKAAFTSFHKEIMPRHRGENFLNMESNNSEITNSYTFTFNADIVDESIDPTQLISPASRLVLTLGEYTISGEDGQLGNDWEAVFPGNGDGSSGKATLSAYYGDNITVTWDSKSIAVEIIGECTDEDGCPNILSLYGVEGDVSGECDFVLQLGPYVWGGILGYDGYAHLNSWNVNATYLSPF